MTRWATLVAAAFVPLATLSCTLDLARSTEQEIARNECSENSDCGAGECWQGACVARSTSLSSVFVEVFVPTTFADPQVGGFRFLRTWNDLSRSSSDKLIDLQPAVAITGALRPAVGAGCGDRAESFPVEVIFTPREESYGLSVLPQRARTRPAGATPCTSELGTQQFTVSVPPGAYDIYVRPVPAVEGEPTPPSECKLAPQLIRRATFTNAASTCLSIPQVIPQELTVVIPWLPALQGADSLDGWKVEVLHPITGHVLSSKVTLSESDRTDTAAGYAYRSKVLFTPVAPDETVKELVRLSPPDGVVAPAIYADRAGLQVSSSEATFPLMGAFLPPVRVRGWVRPASEISGDAGVAPPASGGKPIRGTVIFTAQTLTQVRDGVFASHSVTVSTMADGSVTADLLPGTYRVRVVPEVGSGYAATEDTLALRCTTESPDSDKCVTRSMAEKPAERAGLGFKANPAVSLSGSVVDASTRERVTQMSIDARPATVTTRECASSENTADCAFIPVSILDASLGEAALAPRAASGDAPSGSFMLSGLDCGECTEESGAVFDLLARPPDGSRRAWAVEPGVRVPSSSPVELEVPLPIIHRGTVELRPTGTDPQGRAFEPELVREATIRAYVLRDEQGQWITNPGTMRSCTAVAAAGERTSPCIKSVLQVGETKADELGAFELVLPSELPAPSGG